MHDESDTISFRKSECPPSIPHTNLGRGGWERKDRTIEGPPLSKKA